MRITTGMLNEVSQKSGINVNRVSLLDYVNNSGNGDATLNALSSGMNTNAATKLNSINKTNYEKYEKVSKQLKDSISKLTNEKTDLFAQAKIDNDTSKVNGTIKEVIEKYNELVKTLSKSTSAQDLFYNTMLKEVPENLADTLSGIGITQNKDGTLSIDEDKLKGTDLDTLKKVFGKDTNFSKKISYIADRIEGNASAYLDSLGNTYGQNGKASSGYSNSKYNFQG